MIKKFTPILFAILLLVATQLQAQISIEADDLPNVNTTQVVTTLTAPNVDLGIGVMGSQTWDFTNLMPDNNTVNLIDFNPAEDFTNSDVLPNATFARSSDNLDELLGVNVNSLFPDEISVLDPVAFYSTDEDGNVYLEGVDLGVSILDGFLDFGRKTFTSNKPYRFWATGNYEDELSSTDADTEFSLSIPFEEIAEPLGLDSTAACFDLSDLGFGELCVQDILLKLNLQTSVTIDAYGQIEFTDETKDALRYNESTLVEFKLSPIVFGQAFPDGWEVPSSILQTLCPIEIQGIDACILFQDTTFTRETLRFYGKGENYPIATAALEGDQVASIDYIIPPPPLVAAFDIDTSFNNCYEYSFENLSEGPISNYLWDFGDGTTSDQPDATHEYTENGDYTITLTISNVFETVAQTFDLTVDCPPLQAAFGYDLVGCTDDGIEVNFTNNSTGYYWTSARWSFGDGENEINIADTVSYTYASPGTYEVSLAIQNFGVEENTLTQIITISDDPCSLLNGPVGIETILDKADYSLYPNPANSDVRLSFAELTNSESTVELLDLTGRLIKVVPVASGVEQVNIAVNDLSKGLYLLKMTDANSQLLLTEKLLID